MAAAWHPATNYQTSVVVYVYTTSSTASWSGTGTADSHRGFAERHFPEQEPEPSPKAKAILRRREHADFVDLVGGPTPVPRDRAHSRSPRRTAKHDAWRPRALRRYGTVSTRVRGSVPPGR